MANGSKSENIDTPRLLTEELQVRALAYANLLKISFLPIRNLAQLIPDFPVAEFAG
jgi:hypothetical protein